MQSHKLRFRKSSLGPESLETLVLNAVNLRLRVDDRPNRDTKFTFERFNGKNQSRPLKKGLWSAGHTGPQTDLDANGGRNYELNTDK